MLLMSRMRWVRGAGVSSRGRENCSLVAAQYRSMKTVAKRDVETLEIRRRRDMFESRDDLPENAISGSTSRSISPGRVRCNKASAFDMFACCSPILGASWRHAIRISAAARLCEDYEISPQPCLYHIRSIVILDQQALLLPMCAVIGTESALLSSDFQHPGFYMYQEVDEEQTGHEHSPSIDN